MATPSGAASNRRLYIIVGVGVALVLLNFVVPKLLFKDSSPTPNVVPRPVPGASGGTATTLPGTQPPPPETFEVFSMKNPFTPVVDIGPIDEPGGSTTTTTSFPPTGGSTSTTSTTFQTGGSTTTTLPQSTDPRASQEVEMLALFTDTDGRVVSQVRVDNLVSKVGTGDVFATSYMVVSLSLGDQCGVFLFGDDRFNLCVGEQLLK